MSEREYNRALGILRLVAMYAAIGVLLWFAKPRPWQVSLGFVVVTVGEAIRLWAAGHLTKNVELVTSGPYRYTRNPLYLGRLLILTGLCVMTALPYGVNWFVLLAGWALFFGYYLPRKEHVEPRRLRELHGDRYADYERAVPALLPTLTPYPHPSPRGWSSERMLRNREHWMVIALLAAYLLLLSRAY